MNFSDYQYRGTERWEHISQNHPECAGARPDAKSQVTVEYEKDMLKRIDAIVISHQHEPDASIEQITEDLKAQVIGPVLGDTGLLDKVLSKYVVYASIA